MKTLLVFLLFVSCAFAQYSQYNGTTTQMNACADCPDGTRWYNTTDNNMYLRTSGAWRSFGYLQTTSLIDFKGVWTVKDTTLATTRISATSPPATPQFTYHVKASDIPSAGNAKYVRDWGISIGITGADTSLLLDDTLFWQFAVNNHFVGGDGFDNIDVTANMFYYLSGSVDSLGLKVGDSVQIYLYASLANKLNIQKAVIFIYPRTLETATNSLQWQSMGAYNALPQQPDTLKSGVLTVSGSVVQGSTFAWDSLTAPNSLDNPNSIFAIAFPQILTRGFILTLSTPLNNNNVSSDGTQSGLAMNSLRFQRYYRLIMY